MEEPDCKERLSVEEPDCRQGCLQLREASQSHRAAAWGEGKAGPEP